MLKSLLFLVSLIGDDSWLRDPWLTIQPMPVVSQSLCYHSSPEDWAAIAHAAASTTTGIVVSAAPAPACSIEPADFCFSPGGHCDDRLITLFASAQRSIDVAIYSLNRKPIVDALLAARARGVAVRMLIDNLQSKGAKEKLLLRRIDRAGIEFHHQHHVGIMHMKAAIVDRHWVVHGSTNWTDPAMEKNDEVLSVIDCAAVAESFSTEYEARWSAAREAEEP